MPQYQVQAPDGNSYLVTAPEGAAQEDIINYAKMNGSASNSSSAKPSDIGVVAGTEGNTLAASSPFPGNSDATKQPINEPQGILAGTSGATENKLDQDTGFFGRVATATNEGVKEGAEFQPFGQGLPGSITSYLNTPFQASGALFGAATHGAQQVGEEFGYKGLGADVEALGMAAPMAHGGIPEVPETVAAIDRSKPPILDSQLTAQQAAASKADLLTSQGVALNRLELGLKNPTTLTPEQTSSALANPDVASIAKPNLTPDEIRAQVASGGTGAKTQPAMITDIHAAIDKEISSLDPEKDATQIAQLQAEKAATKQISTAPKLTPEHIENLQSLTQDALDTGIPVKTIENHIDKHLPDTYDKAEVANQIIPPAARNVAEVAPEMSKAVGLPAATTEGIMQPKASEAQNTTAPNVTKAAIEAAKEKTATPINANEANQALGKNQNVGVVSFLKDTSSGKGIPQQNLISKYISIMNNNGIIDCITRIWGKKNGLDVGTGNNLEMADTAVYKNINSRGAEGARQYVGDPITLPRSVWRNQKGTAELKEDKNILPYNTILADAKINGADQDLLNKTDLARNALDDYANKDKVAATHAQTIADNTVKINQLKVEQQLPQNQAFSAKYDLESQVQSLLAENKAAAKSAKALADRETYMPKADALAHMESVRHNPAIQQYIGDMNKLHEALLDDLVTAGKLTPEAAGRLKAAHPNYVPAFRDADDFTTDMGSASGWRGAIAKTFERRNMSTTGSQQIDPQANIIRNIVSTVSKRESSQIRSNIMSNLLKMMDKDAWNLCFRENKQDILDMMKYQDMTQGQRDVLIKQATLAKDTDTVRLLRAAGQDKASAEDITPNTSGRVQNYRTITFENNGKTLEISSIDKNLYKTIANSYGQFESGNYALKLNIAIAHMKREGIIDLDPTFAARTFLRGIGDFPINSTRANGSVIPLFSQIKSVISTARDKEFNNYFRTNYGLGSGVQKVYGHASTDKIVNMIQEGKTNRFAPIRGLKELNTSTDIGIRALQYKILYNKLIAEGYAPTKAADAAMIAARQVHMDFAQGGTNQGLNIATQMVPLLRTHLNAVDKLVRLGLYNPKTLAVGATYMWAMRKAIDVYNQQFVDPKTGVPYANTLDERLTKDMQPIYYGNGQNSFFPNPLGWTVGRMMPAMDKAFDYTTGYLAKSFPEYMASKADLLVHQTPEMAGKVNGRQVADAFLDWAFKWMTPGSALPPALSLAYGLKTNTDDLGHPIVPQSLNDKAVSQHQQYFANSTDPSVISFTNDLHTKFGIDLSPAKALYTMRELFGTFGETSVKLGAHMYAAMSGQDVPAPERGDIPGFKLISGNTSDVPHQAIESKYYNVSGYLKNISAEAQTMSAKATNDPSTALEYNKYVQDHSLELHYAAQFAAMDKALAVKRAEMERIINAKPGDSANITDAKVGILGDEKKREEITNIRNDMQKMQLSVMQSLVDNLDKGNNATNDIWKHNEDHSTVTNMINSILPNDKQKPLDKNGKTSYNILDGLNPVSDANAYEGNMIPHADQVHFPPAQVQQAPQEIQEQYKQGFLEKYLPTLKSKAEGMYRDNIVDYTIKQEGGDQFTETPGDRGGATKFGITLKTLQESNPKASTDDVKNLTASQAKDIYVKNYWDKGQVDKMPLGVQDLAFDMNVNHGLGGATIIIQRALNDLGENIDVDGKLGNNTLNAMNNQKTVDLRAAMIQERNKWVDDIVKNDPSQAKFLPGWKKRIADLGTIPADVAKAEA